jgi:hypothetical protein
VKINVLDAHADQGYKLVFDLRGFEPVVSVFKLYDFTHIITSGHVVGYGDVFKGFDKPSLDIPV